MHLFLRLIAIFLFTFSIHAQEYPIHIMEEGHIVLEVALSDSISGNFILDTGAGTNVLSGKLFQRIKSYAKKTGYFTGFRHDGDRLDGEVYKIPYLAIGSIKEVNSIVGVYPPLDNLGIDGLLSLKFFENRPFCIDFKNKNIKFLTNEESRQLAENNITLPIELHRHTNILLDIFIPIKLNNTISMLAEFDTGSGYDTYIINPNYIKQLELDETKGKSQPYKTLLSGENRIDIIYELESISVGNDEERIVKKDFSAIFREGLIYNALIGSGMFKDKTIVIDIPNQVFTICE